MLGPVQLDSLLRYLSTPEPPHVHWKIIASSVPFTKNWRFGTPDTWGGFLHERSQILAAMHQAERDLAVRVVILSGDRHEFAAIRFPPPIAAFSSSSLPSQDQNKIKDQHRYSFDRIRNLVQSLSDRTRTIIYDRTESSGPHEFSVGPLSMFYLPFRTFKQIDEEDVAIKYLPDGNSKLGVVEITPLMGEVHKKKSTLKYSLFVDGALSWEYTLTSPATDGDAGGRRGDWWWLWS
jgi:alkaline phosphatase D